MTQSSNDRYPTKDHDRLLFSIWLDSARKSAGGFCLAKHYTIGDTDCLWELASRCKQRRVRLDGLTFGRVSYPSERSATLLHTNHRGSRLACSECMTIPESLKKEGVVLTHPTSPFPLVR